MHIVDLIHGTIIIYYSEFINCFVSSVSRYMFEIYFNVTSPPLIRWPENIYHLYWTKF